LKTILVDREALMAEMETNGSGTEQTIRSLDLRIENLKSAYNLFFSGETRVPPEKERTDIEKSLRNLTYSSAKSPRTAIIILNLASKFSLYSNLWLKKLNELESGVSPRQRNVRSFAPAAAPAKNQAQNENEIIVRMTDESTFENLYQAYRQLKPDSGKGEQKEKIIHAIKSKLIASNLETARIELSNRQGKINIKIKK
jgi:hypothetical protein